MKRGYKKLLIIESLFFCFLFLFNFVFKISSYGLIIGLNALFLVLTIMLLGFEKDNFRYKKDVLLTIIIYSFVFFILSYLFSFSIGYLETSYSLEPLKIIKNVFPIFLIIVLSELNRYCLITKSKGFKWGIVIVTIIMIFIDVYFKTDVFYNGSSNNLITFICSIFIPSVFKNVLLSYLSYKIGYSGPIIYRLIFEITEFIFPIFPGYGIYIQSILDVLFPFILMIIVIKSFRREVKEKVDVRKSDIVSKIVTVLLMLLMIIIIVFSSGLFKYYSVAVASSSMESTINKGDVVIVKQYSKDEVSQLEVGEILFFEKEQKLVLHRITDKYNDQGIYYFKTKGDNNVTKDNYFVYENEVKGKIVFRIRFLGWPSVWLSELLSGR